MARAAGLKFALGQTGPSGQSAACKTWLTKQHERPWKSSLINIWKISNYQSPLSTCAINNVPRKLVFAETRRFIPRVWLNCFTSLLPNDGSKTDGLRIQKNYAGR